MSKYKTGDKVTVRKDLVSGKDYGDGDVTVVSSMLKLCGQEVTIDKVCAPGEYFLEGDEDKYIWSEEMFEAPIEFPEGCIVYNGAYWSKVLGACGEVRFLSSFIYIYNPKNKDFNEFNTTRSVQELKRLNYAPYTTGTKPKLTHKQLEEKLGYEFELELEEGTDGR